MNTNTINKKSKPLNYSKIILLVLSFLLVACMGGGETSNSEDATDMKIENPSSRSSANQGGMIQLKVKSKVRRPKENAKTWKRSNKIANTATLFIGDTEKLPLKGSQITVKVDGIRARVLMDCFFYSNEEVQREGTFKMRLPQGATPYYFAFGESVYLDQNKGQDSIPFVQEASFDFSPEGIESMRNNAWTQPKVARVVPKEKAAFAYGQTVQKQVDPALAEWAGADVYNCRVFPLMPKKLHRIVIGYDVNLTSLQGDWIFNFPIPKVACPLVVDFDIANIEGVKMSMEPKQQAQKVEGRTQFRLKNPKMEEMNIRYHFLKNLALNSGQEASDLAYFATTITPELPRISAKNTTDRALLVLDVSLSSNPDKFNVWLKMARAMLENNRKDVKWFNVLLFNVEAYWWEKKMVANTPQNVAAFLKYANQLSLEGASDLGWALDKIAQTPWLKNQSNHIFLLSDGAQTWGENDVYALANKISPKNQLFAFNTGMSGTSIATLNHLCKASGGALFSVAGEDEVDQVSAAFKTKPWKIKQIELAGAKDILIAGRPEYMYAGQKLLLAGRGTIVANTILKIHLSQGSRNDVISIPITKTLNSPLTKRIYGQMATQILEEFGSATKYEAIAYSKFFEVPGKNCSLLMLESEEDYKRFDIGRKYDVELVKAKLVEQVLSRILKDIAESLGDAKLQFYTFIEDLMRMDGMSFSISEDLGRLLDELPKSSFSIAQVGLNCQSRFKKDQASSLEKALLEAELDYDLLTEESEKRLAKYGKEDALKLLSSLIEKSPGNTVMARDVAYSAMEWGLNEQAYYLFKRVLQSRPYEPQTYLALAKALVEIKNFELALVYYEIAVLSEWNPRFGAFNKIAALDYLNLLAQLKKDKNFRHAAFVKRRHSDLLFNFKETAVDLMVTISWNTDNTDIDLHVIDPTQEECYYEHTKTKMGGYITADVTTGYGPEMFLLKDAQPGTYKVRAKYFSSDRNRASTRTKVYATIYRNWGRADQSVENAVVALTDNKEMHDIMTLKVEQ